MTVTAAQSNFDSLLSTLDNRLDADVIAQLRDAVEVLIDATYDHGVNVGFISGSAKQRSSSGTAVG